MSVNKSNQMDNIRKVALLGFTGPNQAMLEYCFSSVVDCELVSAPISEVLIVNGDQPVKDDELQQELESKYPNHSKVMISIRDLSWGDRYVLVKKPHTSQELLDAVRSCPVVNIAVDNAVSDGSERMVTPGDVDFIRGSAYSRQRQGEALKQKLEKGNLVVNAADRLVNQAESDAKQKQEEIEDQKRKKKEALEKKKAEKIKALKLKKIEEKKKQLKEQKKRLAEEKARKLELQLKQQRDRKLQSAGNEIQSQGSGAAPQEDVTLAGSKILSPMEIQQCCGNASDVDLTKAEERRSIFFHPEGSLLVNLTEAMDMAAKLEQVVEVTGLPGKLFVLPDTSTVYHTFDDDFLNQLAMTRFAIGELSIEPRTDIEIDKAQFNSERTESLIWKVALWTARGRLFIGIDPDKSVKLAKPPQLELMLPIPYLQELVDVWSGHSLSAVDVARILDAPQRVVFAFMSGAFSLGWFQE